MSPIFFDVKSTIIISFWLIFIFPHFCAYILNRRYSEKHFAQLSPHFHDHLIKFLFDVIPPGSIPLYISPARIITSVVLLLFAAVIGCAFSLRRVLRVDPASALGSSQ